MIGAEPRGKGTKVLHYNSRLGLIGQKPAYPSSLCPGHTAQAHCTWIQISGYCGPSEGAVGLCLFFCSELCQPNVKMMNNSQQTPSKMFWHLAGLEGNMKGF